MSNNNRFTWNDLTLTAKEFVGAIIFVFSMSGIYYKIYFNQSTQEERVRRVEQFMLENSKKQDVLWEDYIRRKAIEDYKKTNNLHQ